MHALEKLLLVVVSLNLIFLPWALGGVRVWGQFTCCGLSILGFMIALLPRTYSDESTGVEFRLHTWTKLIRFPVFWAGLLLLLYIVIQALNPAWTYIEENRMWWMRARPHIAWLPSGTENPFWLGGPWRWLIVYGAAWLLVCSIWIGFTRRKTLQIFLVVLAANSAALAVFALVQRLAGNGKIYWFWKSPARSFFGPFVYKNHAGGYLLLMMALCCALAAWFYFRSLRRLEKSNPSGLFLFFGLILAIDILVSYARSATLFAFAFLLIALVAFLFYQWRTPSLRRPLVAGVLLLGLGLFVYMGLQALSADRAVARMERLMAENDGTIASRQIATTAALDMLADNWVKGTGAGSFRFLFPIYQQHYPEIFMRGKRRQFWDFAHNDIVQIPIELGAFGVAALLFCGGFWFVRLVRSYFWENALSFLLVTGLFVLLAHGWTDFLFYNPAILLTWCALWPAVVLWTEYEERRRA